MSILNILEWPHPVLETRSKEVTEFNEEFQNLVKDMHLTMDHAKALGLASNQVGILQRVIVVHIPRSTNPDYPEEARPWHNTRYTFVNPVIIQRSQELFSYQEGCLSFPDIYEYIGRPAGVVVEAQDEFGKAFEIAADGLFATCLQHEIDHIDGIVFFKRMSRLKASSVRKKMLKRELTSLRKDVSHG